ncbi:MAG: MFS transporter [Phycisphaerales bacterium]|nr:MFS transporter [Phycisphaerales bacterium]
MSEMRDIAGEARTPLLRNRNFILLWAGFVISALGDRIHFLVMLQLLQNMKQQMDPAFKIGTQETAQLNIMMLLPFLMLGPLAGVVADRFPRRLVMITSDFARVMIVVLARTLFLAVPPSLHGQVPWLPEGFTYVIALLLASELLVGVFSTFFSPARTALLPNLVHPTQLLRANSMTTAAGTIASLVGFVLGAALVKNYLPEAMYVDAGTFLCSGILLLSMQKTPAISQVAVAAENRTGFIHEFAEALRYLRTHKHAMQIVLLMFLFWCAGAVILSGLTGIVTKKFGMTVEYFGYFMGVVGVGMMFGAASVSLSRKGIAKEIGIAWAMTLVGIFLFLFSVPRSWQWALAFLVICGFFGAVLLVSLDTLLQRIVPDYIRGRVMAAKDMLANVGLVGVAVPLAMYLNIDMYILLVLQILAVVIFAVGVMLIAMYYRAGNLPPMVAILTRFSRAYMTLWHRFQVGNAVRVPLSGPVIYVANHTTGYDPIVLQVSSKFRLIQFMMAKEYYDRKPWHYLYKWLHMIPVNRTGNDTASIRTALRALKDGACIGMFPEGKISEDGRLNKGRPGVALLALMSGATVVPAYIQGTRVHTGMANDFLRRTHVTLFCGKPLRFDDIKGHDDKAREEATQRIMGAIAALRDKYETNLEKLKE